GLCELVVLFVILRPLEWLIPVPPISERRARWNAFIYTAIHRLGAFSILAFFLLDPALAQLTEWLHLAGLHPFNLDNLWPGVSDRPLVAFLAYLLVLDFCDYWYHRAQHGVGWLWGLLSLHHSQQNMNLWTDD